MLIRCRVLCRDMIWDSHRLLLFDLRLLLLGDLVSILGHRILNHVAVIHWNNSLLATGGYQIFLRACSRFIPDHHRVLLTLQTLTWPILINVTLFFPHYLLATLLLPILPWLSHPLLSIYSHSLTVAIIQLLIHISIILVDFLYWPLTSLYFLVCWDGLKVFIGERGLQEFILRRHTWEIVLIVSRIHLGIVLLKFISIVLVRSFCCWNTSSYSSILRWLNISLIMSLRR